MSSARRRYGLIVFALGLMALSVAARWQPEPSTASFRIVLGLKDSKPTDWSGSLWVSGGELVDLGGWRFEDSDAIEGTNWKCQTRDNIAPRKRYPVQDYAGKPKGKAVLKPWPNGVHVAVRGDETLVTVKLAQGTFKFAAKDIIAGAPKLFLDGQVRVERLPVVSVMRPAAPLKEQSPFQDDYPAFWVHYKSGKQYLAWVAYLNERDRVLLAERDGPNGNWSKPLEVASPGHHFRTASATTHDGTLWIVWARQWTDGKPKAAWQLYARPYREGKLGSVEQLTAGTGPHLWHRMTTDNRGRAWLVWQCFDKGQSDIFARCCDEQGWREPIRVSASSANDWNPVVTADTKEDRVWVGWDTYHEDNYRVQVRSITGGREAVLGDVLTPEKSPLFQAHVSLACDKDGRLWAAWDEAGPQWGKDTGFLYGGEARQDTTRLYASRNIRVRCLEGGQWLEPAADFEAAFPPDMNEYNDYPQLQADTQGRLWLAFRHRTCRRPRQDGWAAQGRWDVYATALAGDRWLTPVELPLSGGRNDMRIDSQRDRDGNVYFAYASDNRPWTLPGMPPRNHHVAVSRFSAAGKAAPVTLAKRERNFPITAPVHPKEAEQVARIRNYKVEAGGRTYRIYRGDLHRHTDISGDGPGDGSLMDLHRYALDAAAMDFVLVGDHNMGNDNEYCWWRTQHSNDLYAVPGHFISMYGYERSVKYPNGHRNVIWAERGHRTLPLPKKPLPALLKGDTARLYDYLRKTGGICTLHTSASDQGTNWADPHDPSLEPFVEIFQGYHTSYEAPGAPLAIDDKTDMIHGPYKADGFVSFALEKGYKLGFQSSSDHISTHVSYACILAEDFSRKGLLEAMRKRHSYAATDNIVLDVRLGGSIMGDEVRTAAPKLDVVVLGTAPIDSVEILRNGAVVHTHRPEGDTARFAWQDNNPIRGDKASYYYVRVRQKDGNLAWASPIWVTVGS